MPDTVLSPGDKRLKDTVSAVKELMTQWGEKQTDNLIIEKVRMAEARTAHCLWKHKTLCCASFKSPNETCYFQDSFGKYFRE